VREEKRRDEKRREEKRREEKRREEKRREEKRREGSRKEREDYTHGSPRDTSVSHAPISADHRKPGERNKKR